MANEFLDDLFGNHEGYVYSPVKGEKWEQHFFNWPQERDRLERHLNDFDQRDVYISPVLFSEKNITPETFIGTSFLWTEFDGKLPSSQNIIEPTMRVLSSQEGHEHWYWKLDTFVEDKVLVEDLNRRLAFHYEADLSAWDYQQVLRPPDTWNHKRNKPVTSLHKSSKVHRLDDFLWVPIPPAGTKVDINVGGLPSRDSILVKYKWTSDAVDLLSKKEVGAGKRSDALARLTHECLEIGLSNEETYVILDERAHAWGKFEGRTDRQKRIENLISSIRSRKNFVAEVTHGAPEVYRFYDFMQTNIQLKWAIEGLLPVAGSMVIFGKPEIGKSTFSLRLAMALALGKDKFLLWNIINAQRVLFVSLEMQHYEVKEFFKDMQIPEEEQLKLQEQFFIWPIGNPYPFDTPDQQIELVKYIKMHKIELVIIDSLSIAMYGSVTSDDDIKRLNSFMNEDLRRDLKCGYIFIHHPRKDGIDGPKSVDSQDDAFGSTYIGANAQTLIKLSSRVGSNRVHVKILKARMTLNKKDFEIVRTPNRGFELVGSTNPPDNVVQGEGTTTDKKAANGTLGKLFEL